jgi:anaerobic ribonucleoside-triphosphate reductase activating protein
MGRPRSLLLHHTLPASLSNGPGLRAVIWTQGCTLGCPGCYNPETHGFKSGERNSVTKIASYLINLSPEIEGITISGGEPFQQAPALADLLTIVRSTSHLSILVFTGYTFAELREIPHAQRALALIDVLISGRYMLKHHLAVGLLGSANKTIHFLTPRYNCSNLGAVPEAEVLINPDGSVILSGISPLEWQSAKRDVG